MVIVVFAGFFIVFYDSTTSIFPRRVSQLHRHSCLGKRPFGPSGHCCRQRTTCRESHFWYQQPNAYYS